MRIHEVKMMTACFRWAFCPCVLLASACQQEPPVGRLSTEAALVDVTQTAFHPPPTVGGWPGLALFDYDNDGDIDIFVTNPAGMPNLFYENDGAGDFTLVSEQAGLSLSADGCLSAGVGDFDNDGRLDLIISRQAGFFGPPAVNDTLLLMKNLGPDEDGIVRFEDVTARTGLDAVTFGSSIGVGDIDNDGLLDLYIGRYELKDLDFRFGSYLPDTPNVLLHNTGIVDGVPMFEDITESAGVAGTRVAGLAPDTADIVNHVPTWAVYFSDVNEDGWLDLFSLQEIPGGVDLFLNNGDLTFTLAQEDLLNKHGGWMGITAADFDRDGHLDYFLANVGGDAMGPPAANHIANAWSLPNGHPFHRLLRNDGDGRLIDVAEDVDVTTGALPPANSLGGEGLKAFEFGFGCQWFDMQNDGWPDLYWIGDIVLSGLIREGALRRDFHGVGRYLTNHGGARFTDETAQRSLFNWRADLPADFGYSRPGRALAAVDLNGDGLADICRTNAFILPNPDEAFSCLMNPGVEQGHWVTVRLIGTQSNRFGIGARVEAACAETLFVGEVVTTTSAFTAVHPQVHFGLGDRTRIDTLTVRWPSGVTTQLSNVAVDRVLTVTEE